MRRFSQLTALWLILAVCAPDLRADPSKGRWWLGASAGYHASDGSITPNAGDDFDIRPDDYITRDVTIEDTISYSLSAGFGMTERFTLQADVGYFEGDIGKIDTYLEDTYPLRLTSSVVMLQRQTTEPFSGGVLTEIPVTISGVVRFLKDGPFNPYVGAGAGVIFTQVDELDDVQALDDRLEAMRIRAFYDERGHEITPNEFFAKKGAGLVPSVYPMTVEVDDAAGFHLMAGLEYFPTDRISIVADLRYTFMNQEVRIDLAGEDQVMIEHYSEVLFRDDGSVQFFRNAAGHPNPHINPDDPNSGLVGCTANAVGDFDKDGHKDDYCYNFSLGDPIGNMVIQGGEIDLSGFTAQIGVRFFLQ